MSDPQTQTAAPATTITLKATVGQNDYTLRVPESGVNDLNEAVALVNKRFNAILGQGKVKDTERIAVMVALNLAAELNKIKNSPSPGFDFPNTDIASLRQQIGQALRR